MTQSRDENENAAAPTGGFIHISGVSEYKWAWVKAAQKKGLTLQEWVTATLNAAAERDLGQPLQPPPDQITKPPFNPN